jgi:hypothetical protein
MERRRERVVLLKRGVLKDSTIVRVKRRWYRE